MAGTKRDEGEARCSPRRYVSARAVARYLGVKVNTVYRWASQAQIGGCYRFNGLVRFDLDEVRDWADSCRQRIRQPG